MSKDAAAGSHACVAEDALASGSCVPDDGSDETLTGFTTTSISKPFSSFVHGSERSVTADAK